MATLPTDSAYIVSQINGDDPINARVLKGGLGIVVSDSGPGSEVNVSATQILGSIESLDSIGFLVRESGDVADTRTFTSDGTITISAPDGSTGNPVFGVVPGASVQKTNWQLSGDFIGSRATANLIPGEGMGITMNDNGTSIDIILSGGGGGIINPYDGTLNVQNLLTGFTPGPQVDLNQFIATTLNSLSDVQYISSSLGLTTISSNVLTDDVYCNNIRNEIGSTFIDMTDPTDITVNASLFTAPAMETATLNLQQQTSEPSASTGNSILYANENDGKIYKKNPNGNSVFLLEQGDNISGVNYYLDTNGSTTGTLIMTPNTSAQTTINTTSAFVATDLLIATFTTTSLLSEVIQGGQWDLHLYANASDNTNMKYYFNVHKVSPQGVETLIANGSTVRTLIGTTIQDYVKSLYVPPTILPDLTWNIRIKVFGRFDVANGTINTYYRGSTNTNLVTTNTVNVPNLMSTSDIIPSVTDTYDIGKSVFKYRDGFFSRNLSANFMTNGILALVNQPIFPTPTGGNTWVYASANGSLRYATPSGADFSVATDANLLAYLQRSGGSMTGNLDLNGYDLLGSDKINANQLVGTTKTSSVNSLVTSSAVSSVDSNITVFNSTTGKIIKESGVGISSVSQSSATTAKTSESVGPAGYRDPWSLSTGAFATAVGSAYMTNVNRWISNNILGAGTKYSNDGGATWISSTGSVAVSDSAYAFSPTLGIATMKTTASNVTQTTSDGITWGASVNSGAPLAGNIIWANGQFVAGSSVIGSYIQTSPDGLNWTVRTAARPVRSVMWTGIKFVSVGTSGVMSSFDGITWVNESTTSPMLWGVYSPELKCIIGISSSASTSVFKSTDNGETFTTLTNTIPISITFRAGIWVPELYKFYFSNYIGNIPYFFEFDGTNPMTGGALTQQGVPNSNTEVYTMGYTHSLGRFFIGTNSIAGPSYSTKSSNLAVSGNEFLQGNLSVGGTATVTGNFTCVQPHATWYASTSTPIAFSTNTIRLVPLVNTSGLLSGFTNNTTTGVLTYTGTKTRLVKVSYDISVILPDDTVTLFTHFITKNGSLTLGTSQSRAVQAIYGANKIKNEIINISDIISVSTNDTIGLAGVTAGPGTATYSFVNVNVVSLLT